MITRRNSSKQKASKRQASKRSEEVSKHGGSSLPPDKRRRKEALTTDNIPTIVKAVTDVMSRPEASTSTSPPTGPENPESSSANLQSSSAVDVDNPSRQSIRPQELGK